MKSQTPPGRKSKDKVVVVSVDAIADALRAVDEGRLDATVFQDAKGQGRTAVDVAVKLVRGDGVPKEIFIPFKLVTIASGIAQMPLLVFFVSCAVTRGARFFLVAWACRRFGPQITEQLEKRFYLVGTVLVALIVLGLVAIKLNPH